MSRQLAVAPQASLGLTGSKTIETGPEELMKKIPTAEDLHGQFFRW